MSIKTIKKKTKQKLISMGIANPTNKDIARYILFGKIKQGGSTK